MCGYTETLQNTTPLGKQLGGNYANPYKNKGWLYNLCVPLPQPPPPPPPPQLPPPSNYIPFTLRKMLESGCSHSLKTWPVTSICPAHPVCLLPGGGGKRGLASRTKEGVVAPSVLLRQDAVWIHRGVLVGRRRKCNHHWDASQSNGSHLLSLKVGGCTL